MPDPKSRAAAAAGTDLYPYPDEFPQAALSVVLDRFRGQDVPAPRLAHAAANVAYYALGRALPDTSLVGAAAEPSPEQRSLAQAVIDHGQARAGAGPRPQAPGAPAGAFPWKTLLQIALQVLGGLAAVLLLAVLAGGARADADSDARAALALAAALRTERAPAAKACPCSPACTCGCRDGGPCACARSVLSAGPAVFQLPPATAFRSVPSGGPGMAPRVVGGRA